MSKFFADGHLRYIEGAWRDDDGDAVEIQPVRHGRWVERLDGDGEFVHHMCSECKADAFFQYIIEADWDENIDGEWYNRGDEITGIEEFLTDYCPNCGARMDGDSHA